MTFQKMNDASNVHQGTAEGVLAISMTSLSRLDEMVAEDEIQADFSASLRYGHAPLWSCSIYLSGHLLKDIIALRCQIERRTFTKDFRQEAVQLSHDSDRLVVEVAENLGISPQLISRWCSEQRQEGGDAFPGKGKTKPR